MAFVLSGSTITQSGTDANLSGLSAIAGVTTTTSGTGAAAKTFYNIGALQLVIDGTLSHNPDVEELIGSAGANLSLNVVNATLSAIMVTVRNGTYNYGRSYVVNGVTKYSTGKGISATYGGVNEFGAAWLEVKSTGTFNWRGGLIEKASVEMYRDGATVTMQAGTLFNKGGNNFQMRFECSNSTNAARVNVSNLILDGVTHPVRLFTNFSYGTFSGNKLVFSHFQTFSSFIANNPVIANWDNSTNASPYDFYLNGQTSEASIYRIFVDNYARQITGVANVGVSGGLVTPRADFTFILLDTNQAAVNDVVLYAQEINNGNRAIVNIFDLLPTVTTVLTSATNTITNKFVVENVYLKYGVGGVAIRDYRYNTNSTIPLYFWQYGFNVYNVDANYIGLGTKAPRYNLITDTGVTLPEATAVTRLASNFTVTTGTNTIAVIAASTLDDLYDCMKAYKTRPIQAQLEYLGIANQIVNKNGVIADAGAVNITDIQNFTSGTKYTTLKSTGTLTASGAMSSLSVTGNVNQATPAALTNVTITGNLTYNTNTPITVVFTNSTITGTVSNSGTGLVTITLASGSTIGTAGSNVVTQRFADVTAPNIIVGSRVQLYDMTNNVELFNGVLASALNYQHTYVGDITVRLRATYQSGLTAKLPVEATGLLTVSGLSFLNSQTDDGVYIGNLINGSTVTEYTPDYPNLQVDVAGGSSTTVQRLYNWSTYIETTADGIRYLFAAISAIDAVNYLIDQAILDVKLDNTGATPVVISGGVITRKDGTTVIAATSGSIQIDPAKAYVANSAEISIDLQTIKNYTAASV